MTEMDERVERVLAGLREAEVPAGMEERVLRAVRARASVGVQERGWWLGWRVYGVGVVAVLAIVVGVGSKGSWVIRRGVAADKSALRVETSPVVSAAVPAEGSVLRPVARRRSRAMSATAVTVVRSGEVKHTGAVTVSFPAPPLPLTEQERLLLRVVHGHDQVQVAMLDGVSSLAKFAEERTEFQRFFEVPVKKAAPETKVVPTSTEEEKR